MQSKIPVSSISPTPLQKCKPQTILNNYHSSISSNLNEQDKRNIVIEDKFDRLKFKRNNYDNTRTKTQYYCSESQFISTKDSKVDKLKQLDLMKMSNIDDLNYKIQKLISKLSSQDSPIHSMINQKSSNIRFKTQYSSIKDQDYSQKTSNVTINPKKKQFDMNDYEKYLIESKVINQELTPTKNTSDKNSSIHKHQLASIRQKYKKNSNNLNRTESCKSIQIKAVTINNKYNHLGQQSLMKNKQKENKNNKKQIYKKSILINQKQNVCSPFVKNKKNIDQEFELYTKKIDSYKGKREQLQQCKNKQIPLKNIQSQINNKNQKDKSDISPFTHQFNYYPCYNATAIKEQQESQPPTADFRKPQESNSHQNFISHLIKQIKLDQVFRKAKKWFQKYNSSYKWVELSKILRQKKVYFDQTSIHQIFMLHEEEDNPFYSSREKQFNLESLVNSFVACQEHWFQYIVKKYTKQSLSECGFTQHKMDISRKGYLEIQDFVRFLTIERNVQVRNRDLFLIFERLRSQQNLTFRGLMQVICL